MTRRIYWESTKKWALKAGVPVGIAGFALLFMYLSALGVINVTGYSGDSICAGTLEDPCLAYVNFSVKEDIFIYPMDYDPWGRDTPFETDKELESWKMYRSWGNGWREIKLNETCTGTWCGAPDNKGADYSFVFRKGNDYKIKIEVIKKNSEEIIKWGFGPVDPIFFGYNVSEKKVFLNNETIKLITLSNDLIIRGKERLFAEFEVDTLEKNYENIINGMEIYNVKQSNELTETNKLDREFIYKYKQFYNETVDEYEEVCKEFVENITDIGYYDCVLKVSGTHIEQKFNWIEINVQEDSKSEGKVIIGVFTDIEPGESIEWIPTLLNARISQWGTWNESLSVDLRGYWPFEEQTGTLAADKSPQALSRCRAALRTTLSSLFQASFCRLAALPTG